MGFKASIILFLTAVSSVAVGCGDSNSTLYLLVLAPFPNESGGPSPQFALGPAFVPAVRLAVEHINNRSDILCDYTLDYVEDRSGCQFIEQTIVSFTRHVIHSEKHFVGIIGPACSEPALMLAALAAQNRANIVQIAPVAVSPLFDNTSFNNTFRGLESAVASSDVSLELMRNRGWTRVGAVYEATREFWSSIYAAFKDGIPEQQLTYSAGLDGDGREIRLSEIQDHRLRIIFVFASHSLSLKLLCLAYNMGLVYPTYQWIFHHRELSNFLQSTSFIHNNQRWNCSLEDMEKATKGIILNHYSLARHDDVITVANRTYAQYRQQYVKEVGRNISDNLEPELEYSNVYYDSVWALALSLNSSIPFLNEGTADTREPATSVIRQNILGVDFEGMSGPISFSSTTRAPETTVIDVFMVVHNDSTGAPQKLLISFYDPLVSKIKIQNHTGLISDKFEKRLNHVSLGVGIFILLVAVVMILLVFTLHMVNIVFHNEKSLKASSPRLNHLIFSGCYLISVMVIIIVSAEIFVPSMQNLNRAVMVFFGVQCSVLDWCISVSYGLIMGAVCAKQWRIYRIFSQFRQDLGHSLTDSSMIGLICVVVLIDIIHNVVLNAVDPWMVQQSETFTGNVVIIKFSCHAEHYLIRLLILSVLNGLLTVTAVFLATLNRHVHLKAYNETKSINILAYALVIINTLGSSLYALLSRQSTWFFLLPCVVGILDVFLCMFLLFVLPIAPLMKQKFFQRHVQLYHACRIPPLQSTNS